MALHIVGPSLQNVRAPGQTDGPATRADRQTDSPTARATRERPAYASGSPLTSARSQSLASTNTSSAYRSGYCTMRRSARG